MDLSSIESFGPGESTNDTARRRDDSFVCEGELVCALPAIAYTDLHHTENPDPNIEIATATIRLSLASLQSHIQSIPADVVDSIVETIVYKEVESQFAWNQHEYLQEALSDEDPLIDEPQLFDEAKFDAAYGYMIELTDLILSMSSGNLAGEVAKTSVGIEDNLMYLIQSDLHSIIETIESCITPEYGYTLIPSLLNNTFPEAAKKQKPRLAQTMKAIVGLHQTLLTIFDESDNQTQEYEIPTEECATDDGYEISRLIEFEEIRAAQLRGELSKMCAYWQKFGVNRDRILNSTVTRTVRDLAEALAMELSRDQENAAIEHANTLFDGLLRLRFMCEEGKEFDQEEAVNQRPKTSEIKNFERAAGDTLALLFGIHASKDDVNGPLNISRIIALAISDPPKARILEDGGFMDEIKVLMDQLFDTINNKLL